MLAATSQRAGSPACSSDPFANSRVPNYLPPHPCTQGCKRLCDLVLAGLGLLLALPLFALIAAAIKLDSRGSVFFSQERVGLHRRRLRIWKFRKMYDRLPEPGLGLTKRHDSRLTRVGRILERTKLDELPQLLNVLLGQMSIVGPRPELPKFVDCYPAAWDAVLSVKPGVFGPNQLSNRNESELYPPNCRDVEAFYVDRILPEKLQVDADYAQRLTIARDLLLVPQCLLVAILGAVTWQTLVARRWQMANLALMTLVGLCGMSAAVWLADRNVSANRFYACLAWACLVKPACLLLFRIPKALATSMTADDFLRIWWCAVTSAAATVTAAVMVDVRDIGRVAVLIDTAFFLTLLVMYKLVLYTLYLNLYLRESRELSRRLVLISALAAPLSMTAVGACHHGLALWLKAPAWHWSMTAILTMVRPLIMLLMPVYLTPTMASWLRREWKKLLVGSLVGSSFAVLASVFLDERAFSRADVATDCAVYTLIMSGAALWRQRADSAAWASAHPTAQERLFGERSKLLVVGEGVPLNAYFTGSAGLREGRWEVLGVITPHRHARTSTVGGYPILGDASDMEDLIQTWSIKKIIAVKPIADSATVQRLNELARSGRVEVAQIDLEAGLKTAA